MQASGTPQFVTVDDTRFLLVHASPRDPLDEYAYPDVEFWTRRLQNVDADVTPNIREVTPQADQLPGKK